MFFIPDYEALVGTMKFLIVGLGNIGAEYVATRHNAGFMVLDVFAARRSTTFSAGRLGAVATCNFRGKQLVLLKPSTYMNASGKAIAYWLAHEKIPVEQLFVVVDDLALPLGTIRLRLQGSAGGHNGLKDIAEQLGTQKYARLRLGIGHDFARGHQVNFVLERFAEEEQDLLKDVLERSADAIEMALTMGFERAMNQVNTEKSEDANR